MSTLAITRTPDHPASQNPVDFRGLTLDEVIPHLVGHTIDEVERQLILHTLIHCCGSRTRSANTKTWELLFARPESLVSGDRAGGKADMVSSCPVSVNDSKRTLLNGRWFRH